MRLTFIYTDEFLKAVRTFLDEEGLRNLENMLLENREAGDIIQGTHGLRKVRFALQNRGKSSGLRILYVLIEDIVYFVWVFPKNKKTNITPAQRNAFAAIVQKLKEITRAKKRL